ncbi:MAG: hypothetical protein IBX68_07875 [Dehalococcoidia bacterium]|nr:hypothetical protein [Dehalococcoidia bacterium]
MSEIKSAFERAMERAERLGKASEEDLNKWRYIPEGEGLAARCLRDDCNIRIEIDKYDLAVRELVSQGAQKVLVRNLDLPRNEHARRMNKKVMEAVKELKQDKVSTENVYTRMRRIFSHYEQEGQQQRQQATEAVKREMETRMRAAAQQQLGPAASPRFNVEAQPEFQQELRRVLAHLDSQYLHVLDEYKEEILNIR